MKKIIILLFLCLILTVFILAGCSRLDDMNSRATTPAPVIVEQGETVTGEETGEDKESETEQELQVGEILADPVSERTPVKVKGIYISAYVAGTPAMVCSALLLHPVGNSIINAEYFVSLQGEDREQVGKIPIN